MVIVVVASGGVIFFLFGDVGEDLLRCGPAFRVVLFGPSEVPGTEPLHLSEAEELVCRSQGWIKVGCAVLCAAVASAVVMRGLRSKRRS